MKIYQFHEYEDLYSFSNSDSEIHRAGCAYCISLWNLYKKKKLLNFLTKKSFIFFNILKNKSLMEIINGNKRVIDFSSIFTQGHVHQDVTSILCWNI